MSSWYRLREDVGSWYRLREDVGSMGFTRFWEDKENDSEVDQSANIRGNHSSVWKEVAGWASPITERL
jgi:hypothetical protein